MGIDRGVPAGPVLVMLGSDGAGRTTLHHHPAH
jgi:ABC-type branched-subunit amino acid transport system ATPase component